METNLESERVKQVIVMRARYPDGNGGTRKVRTGKMIAQGAHASMAWLTRRLRLQDAGDISEESGQDASFTVMLTPEERAWVGHRFTKVTVCVDSPEELLAVYEQARAAGLTVSLIQDAGDTEFGGVPTYTALAIGPHVASKIDPITGGLRLL